MFLSKAKSPPEYCFETNKESNDKMFFMMNDCLNRPSLTTYLYASVKLVEKLNSSCKVLYSIRELVGPIVQGR